MEEFTQKRFFTTKKVHITNDGIIYYSGNFLYSSEIFISFDEILIKNITREFKTNKIFLWITIGFTILFGIFSLNLFKISQEIIDIILVTNSILFFLFLLLTIFSRKHMLYIATLSGYLIDFYDLNPSKVEIKKFLETLKKLSFKYLKEKYTRIDEDVSFEKQLENFIFLRNKKVITQKEYEVLKKKLKNIKPDVKGFRY